MPLENRKLDIGTRLVGRYKKQDYFAEVVQGDVGTILYRLGDGREFKSLSAAGSAVMGGVACNGLRFWSLAGGQETNAKAETKGGNKPKAKGRKKAQQKVAKVIRRMENQEGVGEGQVRYFCNACMDTFVVEGDHAPEVCPAGHGAELEPEAVEL